MQMSGNGLPITRYTMSFVWGQHARFSSLGSSQSELELHSAREFESATAYPHSFCKLYSFLFLGFEVRWKGGKENLQHCILYQYIHTHCLYIQQWILAVFWPSYKNLNLRPMQYTMKKLVSPVRNPEVNSSREIAGRGYPSREEVIPCDESQYRGVNKSSLQSLESHFRPHQ